MTTGRLAGKRAADWVGFALLVLAGFWWFGCKPAAPKAAAAAVPAASGLTREDLEEIVGPVRQENEQLRQALEVALAAQQDLTGKVRRNHEALASMVEDVGLLRERLHDLELAHDRQPVAASASKVVEQQPAP